MWIGTQRAASIASTRPAGPPPTTCTIRRGRRPEQQYGRRYLRDPAGILWLATWSGFDRVDPASGTITAYRVKDGLGNEKVQGILPEDPSSSTGALWLSTAGSLTRFDPRTETFQNYDASDGLPATGFLSWVGPPRAERRNVRRKRRRVGSFKPAAIAANPYVPPIVFTDLLLGNQAVPISDTSVLTQAIDTTDAWSCRTMRA